MSPIRMGSSSVYGKAGCLSLASPVPHRHYAGCTPRHHGHTRPPLARTVTTNMGYGYHLYTQGPTSSHILTRSNPLQAD